MNEVLARLRLWGQADARILGRRRRADTQGCRIRRKTEPARIREAEFTFPVKVSSSFPSNSKWNLKITETDLHPSIFWQNGIGSLLKHPDFFELIAQNVRIYSADILSLSPTSSTCKSAMNSPPTPSSAGQAGSPHSNSSRQPSASNSASHTLHLRHPLRP